MLLRVPPLIPTDTLPVSPSSVRQGAVVRPGAALHGVHDRGIREMEAVPGGTAGLSCSIRTDRVSPRVAAGRAVGRPG